MECKWSALRDTSLSQQNDKLSSLVKWSMSWTCNPKTRGSRPTKDDCHRAVISSEKYHLKMAFNFIYTDTNSQSSSKTSHRLVLESISTESTSPSSTGIPNTVKQSSPALSRGQRIIIERLMVGRPWKDHTHLMNVKSSKTVTALHNVVIARPTS